MGCGINYSIEDGLYPVGCGITVPDGVSLWKKKKKWFCFEVIAPPWGKNWVNNNRENGAYLVESSP